MIDPPQIIHTTRQPAAVIHLTIPRDQIQAVMGPAIGELMATPAGPDAAQWRTTLAQSLLAVQRLP